MSDIPRDPPAGGEELDLGEIEDGEDLAETDAGQDAVDEGEGPVDAADEGEGGEDEVSPQPRRRETQAQRLRRQLAEKDRELAEARGFRQAAEQFRVPQQPQGPSPAEVAEANRREQEQLSLMSPQEIAAYYYQKAQREVQQALMFQQLQTRDELDRRDFERTIGKDVKYRDQVEREYQAERQRGNLLATRENILDMLIGREARRRTNADAPRQRRVAAQRVAGQQARPTNGRGDGAAQRTRGTWGDPDFDKEMARRALREGFWAERE